MAKSAIIEQIHDSQLAYNIPQAAKILGLSQDKVRAHCTAGHFGFRDGDEEAGGSHPWIISHESLLAWLRSCDKRRGER